MANFKKEKESKFNLVILYLEIILKYKKQKKKNRILKNIKSLKQSSNKKYFYTET